MAKRFSKAIVPNRARVTDAIRTISDFTEWQTKSARYWQRCLKSTDVFAACIDQKQKRTHHRRSPSGVSFLFADARIPRARAADGRLYRNGYRSDLLIG
jgi:hypothetical protein